jgi:hypothetical protein
MKRKKNLEHMTSLSLVVTDICGMWWYGEKCVWGHDKQRNLTTSISDHRFCPTKQIIVVFDSWSSVCLNSRNFMCSRTAPTQASITNDNTGWLYWNISANIVLDDADHLVENDCSHVLFFALLANFQSFFFFWGMLAYCCIMLLYVFLSGNSLS